MDGSLYFLSLLVELSAMILFYSVFETYLDIKAAGSYCPKSLNVPLLDLTTAIASASML
jgi:hypothetical protein